MRFIEDVIERGVMKPSEVEKVVTQSMRRVLDEAAAEAGLTDEDKALTHAQLLAKYGRPEIERRLRVNVEAREEAQRRLGEIRRLQKQAREALRGAVVIVADNVAEYVFREGGKTEWDILKDFPCIMPPFKDCWVEMRFPPALAKSGARYIGYHLYGMTPDEFVVEAHESVVVNLVGKWRAFADRIHCVLRVENYLDLQTPYGPTETYYIALDEQGNPLDTFHQLHEEAEEGEGKEEQRVAALFLAPALLTFSFMHCKNVEVIDNHPPPKLQKARARRGRRPLMSWKTLNIVPMQKVLRSEGMSEETGIKRAIHICRGHFKDFRDKGLFGKHKGLYWWDSQVRGTAAEGVVVKNYKVKTRVA